MDLALVKKSVVEMEDEKVVELITKALADNISPREILENGLIPGMKTVGELFKKKEYFVPEVLLASEAFYAGFNLIQPLIKFDANEKQAKIVIGVVQGDIHDIGKNIVKVLIEAAGFKVIDLGNDVPVDNFINTVRNEKPDILALSSLMTTTMTKMKEIIETLEAQGLRKRIKVIIGGAPVTEQFARTICADGYGEDAADAVKLIEDLTCG